MASAHGRWSEALERFCEGRYFASLEAFDRERRRAPAEERTLCRGWALLAAALFHRDRGNGRGARACLERASALWRGAGPRAAELDLPATLDAVSRVLDREWTRPRLPFEACGPETEPGDWEEDWHDGT